MADIVSISDINKDWVARKGAHNPVRFHFDDSSGNDFDISDYVFSFHLREFGDATMTNILTLTEGAGLTNDGASGDLDALITANQTASLNPETYFWIMLVVDPDTRTMGVFNGSFKLVSETYDGDITTTVDGTINLAGNTISVTVNFPGGSAGAGDVVGPASATASSIVEFNGTTGKLIKDGLVVISAYIKTLLVAATASAARILLGGVPFTLHKNNVTDSFTGTTGESILASISIPAGTIGANDIVRIYYTTTKSGTAGTMTTRGRIHTSGGAVGSAFSSGTVFFTTGALGASTIYNRGYRKLHFKNSLASFSVSNVALNIVIDESQQGAAGTIGALTNDFSLAQFIVITATLASGSDTALINDILIEIVRT